jgi:thioredoxin-related protein
MPTSYKSRYSSNSRLSSTSNSSPEESSSSSGFWVLVILLIILIIGAIVSGTYYKKYENFTDASKNYTLQYYCMTQCGYCRDFETNVWSGYSDKVNNNPDKYYFDTIKYDIMDNGTGKELGDKYNITSTPTILLYNKNTKMVSNYSGDRTEASLTKFANDVIKSENPNWEFTT